MPRKRNPAGAHPAKPAARYDFTGRVLRLQLIYGVYSNPFLIEISSSTNRTTPPIQTLKDILRGSSSETQNQSIVTHRKTSCYCASNQLQLRIRGREHRYLARIKFWTAPKLPFIPQSRTPIPFYYRSYSHRRPYLTILVPIFSTRP